MSILLLEIYLVLRVLLLEVEDVSVVYEFCG